MSDQSNALLFAILIGISAFALASQLDNTTYSDMIGTPPQPATGISKPVIAEDTGDIWNLWGLTSLLNPLWWFIGALKSFFGAIWTLYDILPGYISAPLVIIVIVLVYLTFMVGK